MMKYMSEKCSSMNIYISEKQRNTQQKTAQEQIAMGSVRLICQQPTFHKEIL